MAYLAAEGEKIKKKKKKKKVGKPIGDPVRGRDAPINSLNKCDNARYPILYFMDIFHDIVPILEKKITVLTCYSKCFSLSCLHGI